MAKTQLKRMSEFSVRAPLSKIPGALSLPAMTKFDERGRAPAQPNLTDVKALVDALAGARRGTVLSAIAVERRKMSSTLPVHLRWVLAGCCVGPMVWLTATEGNVTVRVRHRSLASGPRWRRRGHS